jgi:hypothetical protein
MISEELCQYYYLLLEKVVMSEQGKDPPWVIVCYICFIDLKLMAIYAPCDHMQLMAMYVYSS